MKTKLNLTINSELVPRSKRYAKKRGKSVSQLVEDLLEHALNKDEISFSEKWLGKFSLADKENKRFKYLKNRYDL
ncbi:MAG: DUF6364 family protein [Melioribacteraceae bacterium]|nr:DUF6364 family protein [Melioribacteraceae bacterium]MCF8356071.1 DUF6364 family protein [Melioribacteraceae bacterium]MCF8394898.1 DUF6364 family protein [Melioribacteraceae bacterium]MCF8420431.1 DUF6364 family protein [Melioribacteraceae bacterium]